MYDLTVIGAGPVGSYLSTMCSQGANVLLLEEHNEAGNKPCSGLVSPRLLDILPGNLKNTEGLIEHKVNGALIHFMGKEFSVRKEKTAAYVIDRNVLDKIMADHAKSSGCKIKYDTKATGLSVGRDGVSIRTTSGKIESKIVAGCDGARSIVARNMSVRPTETLNGISIYEDNTDSLDFVEMWFDKVLAPGGFLWKIPRGSRTEYGGMGTGLGFATVKKFFKLNGKKISSKSASPIPIGLVKTYSDRLLLVGDSASQTKPWSGGGITYGLLSAKKASEVILKAISSCDYTESSLKEYEDKWKEILLRDIQAGLVFREMYKDIDSDSIQELLRNIDSVKGREEHIDFDFPFSSLLGDEIGK